MFQDLLRVAFDGYRKYTPGGLVFPLFFPFFLLELLFKKFGVTHVSGCTEQQAEAWCERNESHTRTREFAVAHGNPGTAVAFWRATSGTMRFPLLARWHSRVRTRAESKGDQACGADGSGGFPGKARACAGPLGRSEAHADAGDSPGG
jgi:hypothetical protein